MTPGLRAAAAVLAAARGAACRGDQRACLGVVDVRRLREREPERARALGDGRRAQAPAAAARAVGAGEHQRGARGGARGEALEDRGGELGGAEEDDCQGVRARRAR